MAEEAAAATPPLLSTELIFYVRDAKERVTRHFPRNQESRNASQVVSIVFARDRSFLHNSVYIVG